jgi:hypothetical protein
MVVWVQGLAYLLPLVHLEVLLHVVAAGEVPVAASIRALELLDATARATHSRTQ